MSVTFSVDQRGFDQALREVKKISHADDSVIITNTAKHVLRRLVNVTGHFKGRGLLRAAEAADNDWTTGYWLWRFMRAAEQAGRSRAGWWRAWKMLGMTGSPKINNAKMNDREGEFEDGRSRQGRQFVTLINAIPYAAQIDRKQSILDRALRGQIRVMRNWIDRQYSKTLRMRSG